MHVVILGLSITSSWGNGHATNYRALVRALAAEGDEVDFLERDVPWYEQERDLHEIPGARIHLYGSVAELRDRFPKLVRAADLVIVGSYVPEGVAVGEWVLSTARGPVAFFDIDTPVTLSKLERGDHEYLSDELVRRYDLYLSFTGGPVLSLIEKRYGSPAARPFYCTVDPNEYHPEPRDRRWDLGYLGTYSPDRQPVVERALLEPARRRPELRAVVAGPNFPSDVAWPDNVERIEHLPPARHRSFYASQRCTINATRSEMVRLGWSPSVRLFEAAACGVPVISDRWRGVEDFFAPGEEILVADTTEDVLEILDAHDDEALTRVGNAARRRVLAEHTAERRVRQLKSYVDQLASRSEPEGTR